MTEKMYEELKEALLKAGMEANGLSSGDGIS